jgi:hypothetical protein
VLVIFSAKNGLPHRSITSLSKFSTACPADNENTGRTSHHWGHNDKDFYGVLKNIGHSSSFFPIGFSCPEILKPLKLLKFLNNFISLLSKFR